MQLSRIAALCVVVGNVGLVAGCAAVGERQGGDAGGLADDYGLEQDVLAVIATTKGLGQAQRISRRAAGLPTWELHITAYEYALPASCGGYAFRVYEAAMGTTQILEYTYDAGDGQMYAIRDYVAGTNPFIKPGLWTSFDHTLDSVAEMMTKFVETNNRYVPAVYSEGLVTSLPEMSQEELGLAYREAVRAAAECAEAEAQHSAAAH